MICMAGSIPLFFFFSISFLNDTLFSISAHAWLYFSGCAYHWFNYWLLCRWTPYGKTKCMICKQQVHQDGKYCHTCAYTKGSYWWFWARFNYSISCFVQMRSTFLLWNYLTCFSWLQEYVQCAVSKSLIPSFINKAMYDLEKMAVF